METKLFAFQVLYLFVQLGSLCLKEHRRERKIPFHIRIIEQTTYRHLLHSVGALISVADHISLQYSPSLLW